MDDLDYKTLDPNNLRKIIRKQGFEVKRALDSNDEMLKELAVKYKDFKEVVFTGCGDKYIVPLITQFFTDSFTKINARVIHSRILANYTPEFINPNTLVVFLTASGVTTDVIDALKAVKKKNPYVLIITQLGKKKKDSVYELIKDYRKSDVIVPLSDGKITWPASTTFHTFLAVLNLFFTYVMRENGFNVDVLLKIQLLDLPDYMDEISRNEKTHEWCTLIAKKLLELKSEALYFLGDGSRYAAARKGALVHFVESAKQHSFPLENEDFVHLMIEVLADKTKNILFLLKPRESHVSTQATNRYEEIRSLWEEKAGKDKVIIVDPFNFTTPKGIGKKNDILLTPLHVVLLQWLSYYYALYKKVNPAKKTVDL